MRKQLRFFFGMFYTNVIIIIVITARLTLCDSIMLYATLILLYHASMLTLRNSSISRALWLPPA